MGVGPIPLVGVFAGAAGHIAPLVEGRVGGNEVNAFAVDALQDGEVVALKEGAVGYIEFGHSGSPRWGLCGSCGGYGSKGAAAAATAVGHFDVRQGLMYGGG